MYTSGLLNLYNEFDIPNVVPKCNYVAWNVRCQTKLYHSLVCTYVLHFSRHEPMYREDMEKCQIHSPFGRIGEDYFYGDEN